MRFAKDIEMLNPFANQDQCNIGLTPKEQRPEKAIVVIGGGSAVVTAITTKIENSTRGTIINVSCKSSSPFSSI